jgi:hypothetical protein
MSNQDRNQKYRVVTFLKREELDFMDTLEKDIYFTHGIHIPRAKLIEEIIEAFREKGTLDKGAVEEELMERFKKEKPNV